ncbi:MAG: hypothetical protein WA705_27670 [Candidatus Ozemobacteraceae bacterium]
MLHQPLFSTGGFWRFSDQVCRLADFLDLPFSFGKAFEAVSTASQSQTVTQISGQSTAQPLALSAWRAFFQNLADLDTELNFRVFPKPGTLLKIDVSLAVPLADGFTVPPARVLGLDIILQGKSRIARSGRCRGTHTNAWCKSRRSDLPAWNIRT